MDQFLESLMHIIIVQNILLTPKIGLGLRLRFSSSTIGTGTFNSNLGHSMVSRIHKCIICALKDIVECLEFQSLFSNAQ